MMTTSMLIIPWDTVDLITPSIIKPFTFVRVGKGKTLILKRYNITNNIGNVPRTPVEYYPHSKVHVLTAKLLL